MLSKQKKLCEVLTREAANKHGQETRSAANSYWPKIVGVTGSLSTRDGTLTHTHTYTAAGELHEIFKLY